MPTSYQATSRKPDLPAGRIKVSLHLTLIIVTYLQEAQALHLRHQADICIHGHSHKYAVAQHGSILFINPGSAGPARFKLGRTAAILTLTPKVKVASQASSQRRAVTVAGLVQCCSNSCVQPGLNTVDYVGLFINGDSAAKPHGSWTWQSAMQLQLRGRGISMRKYGTCPCRLMDVHPQWQELI